MPNSTPTWDETESVPTWENTTDSKAASKPVAISFGSRLLEAMSRVEQAPLLVPPTQPPSETLKIMNQAFATPLIPVSQTTQPGALGGIDRIGANLINSVDSVYGLATLPAVASSKLIRTLLGGYMAYHIPAQTRQAIDTLSNPKATKADKIVAAADPVLSTLFAYGLARSGVGFDTAAELAKTPERRSVLGSNLKTPAGAPKPSDVQGPAWADTIPVRQPAKEPAIFTQEALDKAGYPNSVAHLKQIFPRMKMTEDEWNQFLQQARANAKAKVAQSTPESEVQNAVPKRSTETIPVDVPPENSGSVEPRKIVSNRKARVQGKKQGTAVPQTEEAPQNERPPAAGSSEQVASAGPGLNKPASPTKPIPTFESVNEKVKRGEPLSAKEQEVWDDNMVAKKRPEPSHRSPIETLNTASQVKITAPKGATMVRVTDANGKTAVQDIKSVQGQNVFQGAGINKIEAGTIGKDKKFVPVKGEVSVEDKSQLLPAQASMGGATPSEFAQSPLGPQAAAMASIDRSRQLLKLDPISKQAAQGNEDNWNAAMAQLDADPESAMRLADNINSVPEGFPIDTKQTFMLNHEAISTRNALVNTSEQIRLVKEQAAQAGWTSFELGQHILPLKAQEAFLMDRINRLDSALKNARSQTGRALQAGRIYENRDYTYAGLLEQFKRGMKNRNPSAAQDKWMRRKGIAFATAQKELGDVTDKWSSQMEFDLKDVRGDNFATPRQFRDYFAQYKQGTRMFPYQVRTLWNYIKHFYIEKGVTDFGLIRSGVSNDLGLSMDDIGRALNQTQVARNITPELYRKAYQVRALKRQANVWLMRQKYPGWYRIFSKYAGLRFAETVAGHAFVPFGTHAPIEYLTPWKYPRLVQDYLMMGRMVFSKGFHEQMMQNLEGQQNYWLFKQHGLQIDVTNPTEEYGTSLTGIRSGSRGFDILKVLRYQKMQEAWENSPEELKTGENRKEWLKELADFTNHSTGVVKKLPVGGDTATGRIANAALFAPRLFFSRLTWTFRDTGRAVGITARKLGGAEVSPAEWAIAQKTLAQRGYVIGVYAGYLAINQEYLKATGSQQRVNFFNPLRSDWLSLKANGQAMPIWGPEVHIVQDAVAAFVLPLAYAHMARQQRLIKGNVGNQSVTLLAKNLRYAASPAVQDILDMYTGQTAIRQPIGYIPWHPDLSKRQMIQGKAPLTTPQYLLTKVPIPAEPVALPLYQVFSKALKGQGVPREDIRKLWQGIEESAISGFTGLHPHQDVFMDNVPTQQKVSAMYVH